MEDETDMPRPFAVEYDPDAETYYVFAPEGCVLVDGVAAQIEGAENGNVALDLDAEDLPDYLYAHVAKGSDGRWNVTFDGEGEKEGAKWNVRVTRFGGAENNGDQYDLATSVVCLGGSGGASVPGNFEPVFADDNGTVKLDDVGEGYWPFGRIFYRVVTVDPSAKIASGLIYMEVTHPTTGGGPSATIKGVGAEGTLPAFDDTSDKTKSMIPLYRIGGGRIEVDFRSCMSLTMREL